MGTTRREWRELRSFAVVMVLIAGVSMATVISCGSGGSDDTDGELCQQCGDTDGPCISPAAVAGDDRPSFCGNVDPCPVELRCLRKLDSGQRRCFPANPITHELDTQYRCDGARPEPDFVATPTPTATATPGEDVAVNITIDTSDDQFNASFTVTVAYPAAKGSFVKDGATDCDPDEGLTAQDDENGTLTLTFAGDSGDAFPLDAPCIFHQDAGQTLVDADLGATASSSSLTVEIGEL